jgi:hypothetical protein
MCKEMPVIPFNKVVDPKRIIKKMEGQGGGGGGGGEAQGVADPTTTKNILAGPQDFFQLFLSNIQLELRRTALQCIKCLLLKTLHPGEIRTHHPRLAETMTTMQGLS